MDCLENENNMKIEQFTCVLSHLVDAQRCLRSLCDYLDHFGLTDESVVIGSMSCKLDSVFVDCKDKIFGILED